MFRPLRSMLLSLMTAGIAVLPTHAETNAGFTASLVGSERLENPAVGQTIAVEVELQGTVEAKGALITVKYDGDILSFVSYTPASGAGALIAGLIALPGTPELDGDGLTQVQGGGTQLTGTPGAGSGSIGTITLQVESELPDQGSFISIVAVQINKSSSDTDVITYEVGEFGVGLVRRFANRVFNFDIKRQHNAASISWESRFAGVDDTLRYRETGDAIWQVAVNPLASSSSDERAAAVLLLDSGIDVDAGESDELVAALAAGGIATPYPDDFIATLQRLVRALRARRRVVTASGLTADTQYEFEARSLTLQGQTSALHAGLFRTRAAPDVRSAVGTDLDVQTTPTSASASWFTNRAATTVFRIFVPSGDTLEISLDSGGSLYHIARITSLEPGTEYPFEVISRIVGVDDLITDGLLTDEQATMIKTGTLRTRLTLQPLRLLGPPARVVSAEAAVINFRLNQIALATIDYGSVTAGAAKAAQEADANEDLYEFTQTTGDILNAHSITLSDLDPTTTYRYRVTVVAPDGESLTTDPRGNEQWSRDLMFTTSAEGDTLPPVIIEGPVVDTRDILAIVRFVTDVDTRATVFFGTKGGTYGTVDEFEIPDQTPGGNLRLVQEHNVTIGGLVAGTEYEYGILVEATNGQTASFERDIAAGKAARVLQPPGGGGSFTTSNLPDTQFPVILSGPTVSTKTHDTAIVEWTTDEPANSEVRFGIDNTEDDFVNSGENTTKHKLVLSNLVAATSYAFTSASTDAVGNGATQSSDAVFTTDAEIDLTAPTITGAPTIVYKNDESATIQWTTDEDATGEVEFGTDETLGFIRTLPTTARVHEVTLTNLAASRQYFYQVSSSDLSNNGPTASAVLTFTTDALADVTSPAISDVAVAAAELSVIITWSSDELADSFVDFGTVSGLLDLTVGSVEDVTEHEVTLTNLAPGTTYFFTVGSIDRAGNPASETPEASFTTLTSADATAPAAPKGLGGSASNSQVLLGWDANSEIDFGGYNLYRRVSGEASFAVIATRIEETAYADPGLANNVTYEYQLTAIDRETVPNESAASEAITLTPTASAAPSVPTALIRTGEDPLQPTFTFTNAVPFSAGAALTYTIQVSTQADFSNVTDSQSGIVEGAGGAESGQTAWAITRELTEGGLYYWRARAVEGSLIGPWTDAVSFTASAVAALVGDFDGDGTVGLGDFFLLVDFFNQAVTGENALYNLDGDDQIGFGDFFIFVDNFGMTATGKRWAFAHYLDEEAVLSLSATGGTLAEQGRITVRVHASQVEHLKAFGLVLAYDAEAVRFDHADTGPGALLESQGGRAPLFRVLSDRPGQLVLGNGLTEGNSVSGQGLLAELTFHTRGAAPTNDAFFEIRDAVLARSGREVYRVAQLSAAQLRPQTYLLGSNFPNPFNPDTHIDYALPHDAPLRLDVFDVLGRRVRTLVSDELHPLGFYRVRWDGRDERGRPVGNGIYFYRLATPAFEQTGKMLLLK